MIRKALKYHEAGNLFEAELIYNKVIDQAPDHFDAIHMLGVLLCQKGDNANGSELIRKAIRINPSVPNCYNNLGKALDDLGKHNDAIACFKQAISLKPDFALAHINLANTCIKINEPNEAIAYCKKAIAIDPDLVEAYNNLGIALVKSEKLKEAIQVYNKAINLDNKNPFTYNHIGVLFNLLGRKEEAIASFKKALALNPRFFEAAGNLAYLYEKANRLDEAAKTVNAIIEFDPENSLLNFVSARCKRRQGKYEEALYLLEKLDKTGPSIVSHVEIYYEKGMVCDRVGQYDQALKYFYEANLLKAQNIVDLELNKEVYFDKITAAKNYIRNHSHKLPNKSFKKDEYGDPVFLIGFPRSGTTLLGQILSSHSKIHTLAEKPLIQAMIQNIKLLNLKYPEEIDNLDNQFINELRAVYFQEMLKHNNHITEKVLIDKQPLNTVNLGLIQKVFPESKIIFALRHPADVCLSCFFQIFELNEAMIHFLSLEDTARLYGLVMNLWIEYTNILPLNYYVIKYEDLISDFRGQTKALFDFLKITCDASVYDYPLHAKIHNIATPSYHQVVEPIYKRSMYRWKHYRKHLSPIAEMLKPYAERFGYPFDIRASEMDTNSV